MISDNDSVEVIKKGNNYQIRITKGKETFSYIITPDKVDQSWIDNIFSMTTSIINKNELN
jgi:hypothetical protein